MWYFPDCWSDGFIASLVYFLHCKEKLTWVSLHCLNKQRGLAPYIVNYGWVLSHVCGYSQEEDILQCKWKVFSHRLNGVGGDTKSTLDHVCSKFYQPLWTNNKFLLAPMGALAPWSAHARPSAQPPIDTSVLGGRAKTISINFLAISGNSKHF